MAYKMKGHSLPGIKQKKIKDTEHGELSAGKRSPSKWVQFIPMALSALSAKNKKDEDEK